MENLALISSKPIMGLTYSPNYKTLCTKPIFGLPILPPKPFCYSFSPKPRSKTVLFAFSSPNSRRKSAQNDKKDSGVDSFAQETTSVGVNPQPYTPPPSQFGSPLFWIGIGVGLSVVFSFVSTRLKNYAMQQAFKVMMGQMTSQTNEFTNGGQTGSPFPFPPPSQSSFGTSGFNFQPSSTSGLGASSAPSQTASPAASETTVAAEFSATEEESSGSSVAEDNSKVKAEAKRSAFVDVNPEEALQDVAFEDYNQSSSSTSSETATYSEVVQNGAASKEGNSDQARSANKDGRLTVDELEKVLDDPVIQQMVFTQLPQEMRNPDTLKWMLQNPVYRQQMQDILDNMRGNAYWDDRMTDSLKNFDLNSPEVKQQFEQLGLTPEEVIGKIMANPDIAMAFQNPKIQTAILEVSHNPMTMIKYQNDEEVMSVFNKIQELFPEARGQF